jgi:hypothetical protein
MIAKYSFGASHANLVMAIYHYHRLHLSDKKRFKTASLNTASKLVFKIAATDELALKERSVKDYWAEFKDSVAFSYAASRLFLYEDVSLLDEILLGRATFRNCKHLLSEWFGQATFAAQHILMHCAEKETASRALQLLPPVSAVQIAPPEFDETQASLIETKFEKNSATRTSKSPL